MRFLGELHGYNYIEENYVHYIQYVKNKNSHTVNIRYVRGYTIRNTLRPERSVFVAGYTDLHVSFGLHIVYMVWVLCTAR